MNRKLRRLFTTLRERSCVSYAKIATAGGICNIDLIVVKATSPDDSVLPEKYVHELLKIFSISPSSFRTFASTFTRRFGNTRCWRVALKCLLLVHHLLSCLPDTSPFRAELLWARSNGFLSLYPCHFQDFSSSYSDDYTNFIRAYAQFIDEALCTSVASINDWATEDDVTEEEQIHESLPEKMKELGQMLQMLPQLQNLIDRVIACRPTGPAAGSFTIRTAMKHIIRDSFGCYTMFRRDIVVVLENLFQMPYRSCITAFGIYKKAAIQASQLNEFYEWCKSRGLCGPYEHPFIERIPQIQIQALETLLDGMWQLTESSSSPTTSSVMASPSSTSDDDGHGLLLTSWTNNVVISKQWEEFEESPLLLKLEDEEVEEPLIKMEEEGNGDVGWEKLLEASLDLSPAAKNSIISYPNCHGYGYGSGYGYGFGFGYDPKTHNNSYGRFEEQREEENEWNLVKYEPTKLNPFYHHCYTPSSIC